MDIFAKLTEVLADHTGRDASEFTPDTTFESLGIDWSLSLRRSWLSNLSACSPCPTDRSIAEYDGRRPL